MELSFDISIYMTLLGITFVIPNSLLYLGNENLLMKIQSKMISELWTLHQQLIKKAQRYSHEKNVRGKKLRIKRMLGRCSREHRVSGSIFAISGLATICCCFSLFLLFASYWYSVTNNDGWINIVLTVAFFSFLDICISLWIGFLVPITVPVIYHGILLLYWIVSMFIGIWVGFNDIVLIYISWDSITMIYHSLIFVPLIPVIAALISTGYLAYSELMNYKHLRNAIEDFEKSRKTK